MVGLATSWRAFSASRVWRIRLYGRRHVVASPRSDRNKIGTGVPEQPVSVAMARPLESCSRRLILPDRLVRRLLMAAVSYSCGGGR